MRIAFGCQARVGKDTACSYLALNYGGKILSFAEPLYELLYHCQNQLNFPLQKDRKFLQFIGTDWARGHDKDVWVKKLISRLPHEGNVFVSDLRFPNEMKALRDNGFVCVQIHRKSSTREMNHESETALLGFDFDFLIENNGDLDEFHRSLEHLVEKVKNL